MKKKPKVKKIKVIKVEKKPDAVVVTAELEMAHVDELPPEIEPEHLPVEIPVEEHHDNAVVRFFKSIFSDDGGKQ